MEMADAQTTIIPLYKPPHCLIGDFHDDSSLYLALKASRYGKR